MRILQVGDGKWGKNHRKILAGMGHDVKPVDIDKDWTVERAWFQPHAVVITCSSVNHWPILSGCLDLDMPVFCEKPVVLQKWQLETLRKFLGSRKRFMAGHQLVFDPDVEKAHQDKSVRYISSLRTGAIPRTEGAILSLAVHDIAVAHYVFGAKSFDVDHVSGDKHNARIVLKSKEGIIEMLVQSMSFLRMRYMTLVGDRVKTIYPDNWGRINLLERELRMFCDAVQRGEAPEVNGLEPTIEVMDTVFKIQTALEG